MLEHKKIQNLSDYLSNWITDGRGAFTFTGSMDTQKKLVHLSKILRCSKENGSSDRG